MIDDFPVFDEALRISVLNAAVQSFGHPFLSGFVSHIQRFVHGDIGEYTLSVFTKSLGSFGFGSVTRERPAESMEELSCLVALELNWWPCL